MKNLAGEETADVDIRKELQHAGITINEVPKGRTEVPYTLIGKLPCKNGGEFKFTRAWYYWVVSGPVPLNVAKVLYSTAVGKRDVRVVGHCGCPPPEEWVENGFINSYHIDSQEGLDFFVKTLRKHNIV
jgi:hypothetical protein